MYPTTVKLLAVLVLINLGTTVLYTVTLESSYVAFTKQHHFVRQHALAALRQTLVASILLELNSTAPEGGDYLNYTLVGGLVDELATNLSLASIGEWQAQNGVLPSDLLLFGAIVEENVISSVQAAVDVSGYVNASALDSYLAQVMENATLAIATELDNSSLVNTSTIDLFVLTMVLPLVEQQVVYEVELGTYVNDTTVAAATDSLVADADDLVESTLISENYVTLTILASYGDDIAAAISLEITNDLTSANYISLIELNVFGEALLLNVSGLYNGSIGSEMHVLEEPDTYVLDINSTFKFAEAWIQGSAGSGGSGYVAPSTTFSGGGGGAPGLLIHFYMPLMVFNTPTQMTVTIATGGAAVTTPATNGNPGGISTVEFDTMANTCSAYGGGGGAGGTATYSGAGGASPGNGGNGNSATSNTAPTGGSNGVGEFLTGSVSGSTSGGRAGPAGRTTSGDGIAGVAINLASNGFVTVYVPPTGGSGAFTTSGDRTGGKSGLEQLMQREILASGFGGAGGSSFFAAGTISNSSANSDDAMFGASSGGGNSVASPGTLVESGQGGDGFGIILFR